MAVVVAAASVWVILAAGITAVWLTEEMRVFGLVMLPAVIVAALLVMYFDWRAKLRARVLGGGKDNGDDDLDLDRAA